VPVDPDKFAELRWFNQNGVFLIEAECDPFISQTECSFLPPGLSHPENNIIIIFK